MLVKSKWSKMIIDKLSQLPFVIDIDFKERRYKTSDWFIIIKVEKLKTEYIEPVVEIINDIENEILKENNEFVGIDFDWEEISE